MIAAVGIGIGEDQDLSKRRYGRDRHHDRRRRRRLAHPHAAAHVLLPADVPAGRRRARVRRPAAAVPRAQQEGHVLRADRAGDAGPAAGAGPGRHGVRPGRRPRDRRRADGEARAARWPRSRMRSSPWSAAASACGPTPMRQDPVTGKLPEYHVFLGFEDFWFTDRASRDAFIAAEGEGARPRAARGGRPAGARPQRRRARPTATRPRRRQRRRRRRRSNGPQAAHRRAARSAHDQQRCSRTSSRSASTSTP